MITTSLQSWHTYCLKSNSQKHFRHKQFSGLLGNIPGLIDNKLICFLPIKKLHSMGNNNIGTVHLRTIFPSVFHFHQRSILGSFHIGGRAGGAVAPSNENLGGHSPPTFQCRFTSDYKYMNHVRSFPQNSCHQNTTRRGPQTVVKVVFDITCGIGDFRAYIFLPSVDSRTT